MRVDDQLGVRRIQVVPERLHRPVRRDRARGGRVEPRVVPDRQHALLRRGGEVVPEPGLLRRAHGRRNERVVAVQHDDVPGTQVEAVIALGGIAGDGPIVAEVTGRRRARVVVMLPRHGEGPRLVPSPRRVVAGLVRRGRSLELPAAGGEHGARDRVEDRGRGVVAGAAAARDVAGAHERDQLRRGVHRERSGARRAELVGHADANGVRPARSVDMRGGDRRRRRGATGGLRRAVGPVDRVGPGAVVRAVREARVERHGAARGDDLIGARVHHGR